MSNTPNFTPEQVEAALRSCKGFVFHAAKKLKCTAKTVYNYLDRYPHLKTVLEECRGEMTDNAELALCRSVMRGDPWAVQFYLKTQAKHRGYTERTETMELTEDQVDRLLNAELGRLEGSGEGSAPVDDRGHAEPGGQAEAAEGAAQ